MSYDNVGSITSLTPPALPAHSFTYTDMNRIATYTPPAVGDNAGPMRVTYDLEGRVTRVVRLGGDTISYAYDSLERVSGSKTSAGNTAFEYDAATGRLRKMTGSDGSTFALTYDGGLLTRRAWTGSVTGSIATIFDNNFLPVAQRVNDANEVAFVYDNDGKLVTAGGLTFTRDPANALITGGTIGGVVSAFTYDQFSAAKGITATFGGNTIFDARYTRDSLGRVVQDTETAAGVETALTFQYDSAGRLKTVLRNGGQEAYYEYDPNGNRIRATAPSGVAVGTYDAQDRLVEYGATSYRYTQNGDLRFRIVGSDTTTYTYSSRGELLEVKLPTGTRIDYVLDPMGRRVGKKINGVLVRGWLHDAKIGLAAELDGCLREALLAIHGAISLA